MASLWILSCFTLIGVSVGSGVPASDLELSITPRIIGGKDALPGACPWHVSLVVFIHPDFNATNAYSDIALLKLGWPAHFDHTVYPVPLPSFDEYVRPLTFCKIFGFGYLYLNGTGCPKRLQEAIVPILRMSGCLRFMPGFIPHFMLCAGIQGIGIHSGDPGGSMVCRKNGIWTLTGILSSYDKDERILNPFVLTRVSKFIPWIKKIMANN
ncbi:PREDICTED: chymotrypsinogen B2-like [Condylura cristata]|uniref:chymotrypsinogen B2-like n=1 Tax=Condylura cristata TaxID=143302 RepID=UPI00033439DE|nr:PREDICTED: chymotrypsinogen B2-like [Condylura cristata]